MHAPRSNGGAKSYFRRKMPPEAYLGFSQAFPLPLILETCFSSKYKYAAVNGSKVDSGVQI
eukprot:6174903-Pleurochrysis_carterae.AAC.1